jgi:hypothetical protein
MCHHHALRFLWQLLALFDHPSLEHVCCSFGGLFLGGCSHTTFSASHRSEAMTARSASLAGMAPPTPQSVGSGAETARVGIARRLDSAGTAGFVSVGGDQSLIKLTSRSSIAIPALRRRGTIASAITAGGSVGASLSNKPTCRRSLICGRTCSICACGSAGSPRHHVLAGPSAHGRATASAHRSAQPV